MTNQTYRNLEEAVSQSNSIEFLTTRHSKSGEDAPSYPGLSQDGVEMARSRAEDMIRIINDSPDGTVLLYGGISNAPRTGATAKAYIDEMQKILGDNIYFVRKKDIKKRTKAYGANPEGYMRTIKEMASELKFKPNQKVVVELPMPLKSFCYETHLAGPDGKTDHSRWTQLHADHKKDYSGAIAEWFSNPELIKLFNPEEIARRQIKDMETLANLSKKLFPNRPVKIGFVGHSFLLDALQTYLANDGKISREGFEKIGGKVVDNAELARIAVDEGNNMYLQYRGKDFVLDSGKGLYGLAENDAGAIGGIENIAR